MSAIPNIDYQYLLKPVTLANVTNQTIPAKSTVILPSSSGVDIKWFNMKTISVKADYALTIVIEVSDDQSTWDEYYSDTLTADKLSSYSFQQIYNYVRVKLTNPDTSDHTLNYLKIKGRRL